MTEQVDNLLSGYQCAGSICAASISGANVLRATHLDFGAFRVNTDTMAVEIKPGVTVDEAASRFWDAVGALAPA